MTFCKILQVQHHENVFGKPSIIDYSLHFLKKFFKNVLKNILHQFLAEIPLDARMHTVHDDLTDDSQSRAVGELWTCAMDRLELSFYS